MDGWGGQMNQLACHPNVYELLALREMVNPVLPVSHASENTWSTRNACLFCVLLGTRGTCVCTR